MRRNSKQERTAHYYDSMARYGIGYEDANKLRLIEKTLQHWAELECGDSNQYADWAIERDEQTDKPFMVRHVYGNGTPGKTYRTPVADREKGALKRLDAIMAKYPDLLYYHQTDPRGCALYILRKSDVPKDYFEVVKVEDGWSILRQGSTTPYGGASTKAQAKAFAFQQTVDSFYTRGLAACID